MTTKAHTDAEASTPGRSPAHQPPAWTQWWADRWPRLVAFVVVAIALGSVMRELSTDGAKRVQEIPGKSVDEIRLLARPEVVVRYIRLDLLLILLVAILLVLAMSIPSRNSLVAQVRVMWALRRRSLRSWPSSARWKALGGISIVIYVLADVIETLLLWHIVENETRNGLLRPSSDQARWLAGLYSAKWISVTAAVLIAVSVWGRRTPTRRDPKSWEAPDTPPPGPDWDPSDDRFGVTVSGGGVRSASFALGVIGELRRRGMLAKARYVTSVSGGSYATAGLERANRTDTSPQTEESFKKATESLRRRLNYLLTSAATTAAALFRVLMGLLVNLTILYFVILVVARPVGWLIGAPLVQEGLRYDGPVVLETVRDGNDPDVADEQDETWAAKCGLDVPPDSTPVVIPGQGGPAAVVPETGESGIRVEFDVVVPTQCALIDMPDVGKTYWAFTVDQTTSGLLRIDDGVTTLVRQPEFAPGPAEYRSGADGDAEVPTSLDVGALLDLHMPDLEVSAAGTAATADSDPAELLQPAAAIEVDPVAIVDLRGDIDIDTRHVAIPALLAVATVIWWSLLGLNWFARLRLLRRTNITSLMLQVPKVLGCMTAAALAVFLALPWLVKVLPEAVSSGLVTGPADDQTAGFSWWPTNLPPLLAWPLLGIGTVSKFLAQRKSATPPESKSKKRNSVAFLGKVTTFVTRLAVGVILLVLLVGTATASMTTGALNGPFGTYGWISQGVPVLGIDWPEDIMVWAFFVLILLLTRTMFSAGSWSLAPYYRSRLRWAFMGDDPDGGAFDGRQDPLGKEAKNLQAGYLAGTNAELVICCAGNIVGSDRAPAGRRAVSFTASRSWIGGPELGWMRTSEYLDRLSPARQNDVTIAGMTALSGAAASPAMGKASLGPIGSVLAILNVRLGGWLPHPRSVQSLSGDPAIWKHTPGWTYYVREVLRRFRSDAAYVYVSDGGHWENLGLVESLRRGCNSIVVVSAAGDGASSHATLAEAVEIARTDLDIDIEIDSVWQMRPVVPVDGKPDEFINSANNRQFLRQDGDNPEIGSVAPAGWTFGTFTRNGVTGHDRTGNILIIEATMTAELPMDVQAYAEGHAEFPDINTGDQFFNNRDYESYRLLGETLARHAFATTEGQLLESRVTAISSPAPAPMPPPPGAPIL